MCGIIGYTGNKDVTEMLLDTLEMLEYRGYDSAGIAVSDTDGKIRIVKCAGRVKELRHLFGSSQINGNSGMGHTRWATHGGVTDQNAHPHRYGHITLIHNGIIENYRELKEKYQLQDMLNSETDTEIVAGVINHFYNGDPLDAIRKSVVKLKGTFALVIMFDDFPDTIFAIRNVSPIVVSSSKEGNVLASDVAAVCQFSKEYFVLPELHTIVMNRECVLLYDLSGECVEPDILTADWELGQNGKGGFPFYMEKEIMEQPEVIQKTIEGRIVNGLPFFSKDEVTDEILKECNRICVVACGTAMHAGLVGQVLAHSVLGIHMDVELASEFMYADPVIDEQTLVIAISQSGETIDTLEALKYAKRAGAKTLSIINVRGASIARESDYVIYTYAGPEVAVASTKAYTTQLSVLYLLTARMALVRGVLNEGEVRTFISELQRTPEMVDQVLQKRDQIHKMARRVLDARDTFMIGRGLDYSILLEGSLKLKEISYIHSEAYASGELKHGTIALITDKTPVVAMVTQSRLKDKEMSNIREVCSRGAKVMLFTRESFQISGMDEWSEVFELPDMQDLFMVLPASVALQLFAYYVSADKGYDVDKPRNLAKVVTVE